MTLLPSSALLFSASGQFKWWPLRLLCEPMFFCPLPPLGFWSRLPSLALCILVSEDSITLEASVIVFVIFKSLSPSMTHILSFRTMYLPLILRVYIDVSHTPQIQHIPSGKLHLTPSETTACLSSSIIVSERGTTTCQLLFVLDAFHTFFFQSNIKIWSLDFCFLFLFLLPLSLHFPSLS